MGPRAVGGSNCVRWHRAPPRSTVREGPFAEPAGPDGPPAGTRAAPSPCSLRRPGRGRGRRCRPSLRGRGGRLPAVGAGCPRVCRLQTPEAGRVVDSLTPTPPWSRTPAWTKPPAARPLAPRGPSPPLAPRGTRQHCGTGLGAPGTGTSPPESTDIQKRGPKQTATKALFAERSSSFRRRREVPRCPAPVPGDAPDDGLGVRRPASAAGECTHAGPRGALPLCGFSTPRGDRASGTDLAGGLRTSGSGAESEGRAHRAACGPRARDSGAKPLSALAWGPLTLACEPGERCRRGTAWGKTTLPLRGEACSWFPPALVVRGSGDLRPWPAEASCRGGAGGQLPLLARCRMVSICSPDSFAFFIADVARGQPDKLGMEDGGWH